MFEIAGLFLDDMSNSHIKAVHSLSVYLNRIVGEKPSLNSMFAMQSQLYQIQEMGAASLTKMVMKDRGFDCKGGCDSCCHATDVGLTPVEAFYLADHIRQNGLFNGNSKFEVSPRENEMDPCPLLKDGWCTVYEARPLSCRYILSTELASCLKRRETLIGGAKLPPPYSHFRSSLSAATFVMFAKLGLDARWLVLDQSIERILNDKNIADRWLNGTKFCAETFSLETPNGKFGELVNTVASHP